MAAQPKQYGQLLKAEPMARHTSWRAGGIADVWFKPSSKAELVGFLQDLAPETPLHWVGLGSNLLVRDGGVRGVVISLQDALNDIEDIGDGRVAAGAGVACTILARFCVRRELGPAEFFAGIPGTVGGALAMNAGAFGGETWQQVESVEVINRKGEVQTRQADEYTAGYRHVTGPANEWFLSGCFSFQESYDTSMDKVKSLVGERKAKQPLGLPSCGSVFRNPPGDHSARLIETAGLKGYAIGGAVVSEKHANFIINDNDATAADIESLIQYVQSVVHEMHGILLVPEVHIIGESVDGRSS
jgi:UDP-N-acetylmuramate dehydrogenase